MKKILSILLLVLTFTSGFSQSGIFSTIKLTKIPTEFPASEYVMVWDSISQKLGYKHISNPITLTVAGASGPATYSADNINIPRYDSYADSISKIPVSIDKSGIVDNTPLQELGGVDKMINGVRIGRGSGNLDSNLAFGVDALNSNTTGLENTAIGGYALSSNTTGGYNLAVGNRALNANTTGISSLAIGSYALAQNTTGGYNTAIGSSALAQNTTGSSNTAIGGFSLHSSVSRANNTAIGVNAMQNTVLASASTAIGVSAMASFTGTTSTAIGVSAMQSGGGERNVAIGSFASRFGKGNYNTTIGYLAAGNSNSYTGSSNIVVGFQAGRDLTTGSNNILIENIVNASVTTGSGNIIIDPINRAGVNTGSNNTLIGGWNSAFGSAMSNTVALGAGSSTKFISNNEGSFIPTQTNTLIDADATGKAIITKEWSNTYKQDKLTAGENISIVGNVISATSSGGSAPTFLQSNSTNNTIWNYGKGNVIGNTSFGQSALDSNTTGSNNSVYGANSLSANTTGQSNVAVGHSTLSSTVTGIGNVAVGNLGLSSVSTGNSNTAIGTASGRYYGFSNDLLTSSSNSVFIGAGTRSGSNGSSNEIVIGDNAVGAGTNTATIGGVNITKTILRGSIVMSSTLTQAQRVALVSPAIGTHVYQSDGTEGVYVYKSSGWVFAY